MTEAEQLEEINQRYFDPRARFLSREKPGERWYDDILFLLRTISRLQLEIAMAGKTENVTIGEITISGLTPVQGDEVREAFASLEGCAKDCEGCQRDHELAVMKG